MSSLSTPATAEAEARAAAPARPPRAAEALQRAAAAPYLDSLDRRYLAELRSARERGEAGRYLASLGAANKLNELRSREAATTEHYLDGLDRSKWTATAFSQELERRRQEKLTVARKPSFVSLVEDAPPVLAPAVEIHASDLPPVDVIEPRRIDRRDGRRRRRGPGRGRPLDTRRRGGIKLAWKGAMLFVTVAWATNFAVTAYACTILASTSLVLGSCAVFVVAICGGGSLYLTLARGFSPRSGGGRRESVFCTLSVMVPKRRRWRTAFRRRTRRSSVPTVRGGY